MQCINSRFHVFLANVPVESKTLYGIIFFQGFNIKESYSVQRFSIIIDHTCFERSSVYYRMFSIAISKSAHAIMSFFRKLSTEDTGCDTVYLVMLSKIIRAVTLFT